MVNKEHKEKKMKTQKETNYNYAELLAIEAFELGPNKKPFEVATPLMERDLGVKGAKYTMMYDEDFIGDFLSMWDTLSSDKSKTTFVV